MAENRSSPDSGDLPLSLPEDALVVDGVERRFDESSRPEVDEVPPSDFTFTEEERICAGTVSPPAAVTLLVGGVTGLEAFVAEVAF